MKLRRTALATALVASAFAASAGKAETTDQKFGDWTFSHIKDPLDDTDRYIAYVQNSSGNAAFMIKCDRAGDPDLGDPYAAFVKSRTYFGDDDRTQVRYRIDDNPVQEARWELSDSGVVNFDKSEVRGLAEDLKRGIKFIFEARDYTMTHIGAHSRSMGRIKRFPEYMTVVLVNNIDKGR